MAAEDTAKAVEETVKEVVNDKGTEATVKDAAEDVKKVADGAADDVKKGKFDFILKPLGALINGVKGAGVKVKDSVGGALNAVGEKVPAPVKNVGGKVKEGGEKVVKQVNKVAEAVVVNVAKAIKAVSSKVPGLNVDEDGAEKAAKIGLSAILAAIVAASTAAYLKHKGIIGEKTDEAVEAVEKEVDSESSGLFKKIKKAITDITDRGSKEPKGTFVTVTPGDTVRKLAPGLTKDEFYKLNPEIADINQIKIGQQLRVA